MTKYHVLWRLNPAAPWPMDPIKALEMNEKMWMAMDDSMKKGLITEYGVFPDGTSGYLIGEGDATNILRGASIFVPFIMSEAQEIIPYEKQKEVLRGVLKAQIAAMKK